MDIIWIARAIRRIGDHAKNVGEHVIYIVEGRDIRHPPKEGRRMNPTILVVEDEPAIQELVAINLKHAGFLVVRAGSAEGESAIRAALPDLVILDWMLAGQSGVALAKKLRADDRTRDCRSSCLARVHEEDKIQGLEAGADDYVTKPFSPRNWWPGYVRYCAAGRPIWRVKPWISGSAAESGNPSRGGGGPAHQVGPTEFRLLFFFMTHPERVYTRAQLLDEVWGDHVFIEEQTVDVHIRRLRAALEPSGHDDRGKPSAAQAIVSVGTETAVGMPPHGAGNRLSRHCSGLRCLPGRRPQALGRLAGLDAGLARPGGLPPDLFFRLGGGRGSPPIRKPWRGEGVMGRRVRPHLPPRNCFRSSPSGKRKLPSFRQPSRR